MKTVIQTITSYAKIGKTYEVTKVEEIELNLEDDGYLPEDYFLSEFIEIEYKVKSEL